MSSPAENFKPSESLASLISENKIDLTRLNIAFKIGKDGIPQIQNRREIHISDGQKVIVWQPESIWSLFRENTRTDQEKREAFVRFFYGVEYNVGSICHGPLNLSDFEFNRIYRVMFQKPDAKSEGVVHDIIWQSAALQMGLREYSKNDYGAIFSRLCQATDHFNTDYTSRNYTAFIRKNLLKEEN